MQKALKLLRKFMYWKQFLGLKLREKKSLIKQSPTVFLSVVFVLRLKIDQDKDEEFANLVTELAGDVDPDDYVDFDKDIASSILAVDAGSISWRQDIRKKIIKKHENPADEVMDVSSDEDVDQEVKDPERIKSAFDALQVMD